MKRTMKGYKYDWNWCDVCGKYVGRNVWARHLRSKTHMTKRVPS